jgi:uncharacterized protein (TIGR02246 family)
MGARKPEDMARLFADAFNRGDLEALVALYEPGAILVTPGGAVSGLAEVRRALAAFLASRPRIEISTRSIVTSGDTALVRSGWTLRAPGPDGAPVEQRGLATEVLRCQPDGTWRYVIDDPNAG